MALVPKTVAVISVLFLLSGCVSTAKTIVSAPFKAGAQVVDWSTTSQEEADRNRGRAMRERDERLESLERDRQKAARQCAKGKAASCQRQEILSHEMDALLAQHI